MKKQTVLATLMLCGAFLVMTPEGNAQNNRNDKGKNKQSTNATNTTQGTDTQMGNPNTTPMPHSNDRDSSQANNITGGNVTAPNTDAGMDNGGNGQLSSTGRYSAMGIQAGSLHRKDLKFVLVANSSNLLEIQASQLAMERAMNPAVKEYASMMVSHHTMAGQQMKQLLASKGTVIPEQALMKDRHRMQLESISNLRGAEFDRAYMRLMVDAHEEDVDEYEDETTDARDADLRAFTVKMMPTLQQHYSRARELRKQL